MALAMGSALVPDAKAKQYDEEIPIDGVTEWKSGWVIPRDAAGQEVGRHGFTEVWPCQVIGPSQTTARSAEQKLLEAEEEVRRAASIGMLHKFSRLLFAIAQETGNKGFGAVAQSLTKLKITPEKGDKIELMFNRREYTTTKATPWKHHDIQGLDAPTLEFTNGDPYQLQFEIFFDRYEEAKSVRELTDKIEKLSLAHQELHRPPTALLTWGTGLAFKCILESFSLRFTLFLDDEPPVRAVMNIKWRKPSPAEDQLKGNPRH